MVITVRSTKNGEGGAREASDVDFTGGKARGAANGVVIGVFLCSLQTMANICAIVWLTRSTPPPLG